MHREIGTTIRTIKVSTLITLIIAVSWNILVPVELLWETKYEFLDDFNLQEKEVFLNWCLC